jgi:hypothetical protein
VIKWAATTLVLALTAGLAIGLVPAALERDAPRDLPWALPDYRQAALHWEVDDLGRIHNHVEHFFLRGISPLMVSWFYRQLPVSTVDYEGVTYPLYHIFHPTEHGRIRVLEAAEDGRPGMGAGAVIMREEWFGPYDSRGKARLVRFDDTGMLAIAQFAGADVGRVKHDWRAENGGTRYGVTAVIGVDWPVIGPLVNWCIRRLVFHPQMMDQWQRHQIEEVASLQFFLPALYAQRDQGNAFQLRTADVLSR